MNRILKDILHNHDVKNAYKYLKKEIIQFKERRDSFNNKNNPIRCLQKTFNINPIIDSIFSKLENEFYIKVYLNVPITSDTYKLLLSRAIISFYKYQAVMDIDEFIEDKNYIYKILSGIFKIELITYKIQHSILSINYDNDIVYRAYLNIKKGPISATNFVYHMHDTSDITKYKDIQSIYNKITSILEEWRREEQALRPIEQHNNRSNNNGYCIAYTSIFILSVCIGYLLKGTMNQCRNITPALNIKTVIYDPNNSYTVDIIEDTSLTHPLRYINSNATHNNQATTSSNILTINHNLQSDKLNNHIYRTL